MSKIKDNLSIKLLTTFLLALTLSMTSVQGQTLNNLSVGDVLQVKMKELESQFYKLKIGSNYYEDEDLIIKVIPQNFDTDPDIYISKSEKYPNSSAAADWMCTSYGKDTCTINHKNISRNDVFYIGITCPNYGAQFTGVTNECKFEIKVMLTSEFQLEDGVEFQTYLYKEDARVFSYTIPQMTNDQSSVIIKASAYRGNVHDFSLTVASKANHESPGTNYNSKKGIDAWKQGQVVRINKDNFDGWCHGCEIKILLDIQDEGYYHIMAQSAESKPLLYNGEQIDDIVSYNDIQCYQYYIKGEDNNVQVQLTTYSGKVVLQGHPSIIPEKWEDFRIRTETNDTEVMLDIRAKWRSRWLGQPTGLYYFCVKGELTSTYSLKLREYSDQFQTYFPIQDGYTETFFLRHSNMNVHLYQVPKLEYTGEDIQVTFDLTVRRGTLDNLVLAAAMCTNTTQKCVEDMTRELVLQKNSKYQRAKQIGTLLRLSLDHDEKMCQDLFGGECYYVIAVLNTDENSRTLYKITASHSQNNHIMLQESYPYIDSIDLRTYKYYKFNVVDDTKVTNVTFEITPYHGDCDLFVSRSVQFPTKDKYDVKSQRLGAMVDHVSFDKNVSNASSSLAGTYYVGVYGYTYASFSILVSLHRQNQDMTKDQKAQALQTMIYEGYPLTKSLHNELETFHGYFTVDIPEGEEEQIIIEFQNSQGKARMRVKYGATPTVSDYDYRVEEGILKISPGDKAYHRNGTYYIYITPEFSLMDLFRDNYYTFSFQWRTQSTTPHLNSQTSLSVMTDPQSYSYVKHYVQSSGDEIRISLQSKGHQDVYVSLNPRNKKPNNDSSDMTTKFQKGGQYQNGKSLLIPFELLKKNNPACEDMGYAEDSPCVIYIGVQCQESYVCTSQIELDYEQSTPKRIYSGQLKHAVLSKQSKNYFYLSVSPSSFDDVYGILQPLSGDADLFVTIQKISKSDETDESGLQWDLPTLTNYFTNSKTKLNTEIVHITKEDLQKECGFNGTDTQIDCVVLFGIFPAEDQTEEHLLYNFNAYVGVMQVKSNVPAYGYVKEGEFSYFIYRETCADCNIIISLSSYSNGDPDIYINKGTNLPSKEHYDIKRMTIHSEIITLSTENEYFKKKNITSMDDYYVIGVFGVRNTTFHLSIASQDEPISNIQPGLTIKHSQKPYDIVYFQYYHFDKNDIEINVAVSLGAVDMYVTTFNTSTENFVDILPTKKSDATWITEDINSLNHADKSIVILDTDRDYCSDCYYIIGIVTHEGQAQYNIQLHSINAETQYSHLLRLGTSKSVKLLGNNTQVFQFMIESLDPVQIIPTMIIGSAQIYVGFSDIPEEAFAKSEKGSPLSIKGDQLKTEKNYYVILRGQTGYINQLTLTVHQNMTIITMHDGVPQTLYYDNENDASKYMLYNLPRGNSTIQFNIKSKTDSFFPWLLLSEIDHSNNEILFPPANDKYKPYKEWDEDLYVLKVSLEYNIPDSDTRALAINLIYHNRKLQRDEIISGEHDTSGIAIVTISHTKIIKLAQNEEYYGELSEGYNMFQLFQISPPFGKKVKISYSDCIGLSGFGVLQDPGRLENRMNLDYSQENGNQIAVIKNLTNEAFIVVESMGPIATGETREYLIKVEYMDQSSKLDQVPQYFAGEEGHIDFEYVRERKGNVQLKWGPIYKQSFGKQGEEVTDARYKLVFSENPLAVMNSACAVKKSAKAFSVLESLGDVRTYKAKLTPNKETQFNVIAIVDKDQIVVPYKPIVLKAPSRALYGSKLIIVLLTIALIAFGIMALWFFFKGKNLEHRLRNEVREINSGDGEAQTYHKVGDTRTVNYDE